MGGQAINDDLVAVERTAFTGMNTRDYAGIIGATEVAVAENVDFSRLGLLCGIGGYGQAADSVGTDKALALCRFQKAGAADLLMMAEGANLRSWPGSGNWSAPVFSGLSADRDTMMVVGNDVMLISNGADNVRIYDQTETPTDAGDTNASAPKARVGAYINNRFILANTENQPDYFWFSEVLSTTFDRATNVFKLNSGSGKEINGIIDLGLGEVVFLKEDEIHTVDMSSASPGDWGAVLSFDDGSVSKKANVRVGNDVFYLSRKKKGIASVGKNEFDKIVGRSVAISSSIYNGYMENINWAYAHNACAALFDNMLIFAVPIVPSTVPDCWVILFLHDDNTLNGWAVRKAPPTYCFGHYPVSGTEHLFFGDSGAGRIFKAFSGDSDAGAAIERVVEGRYEDFSEAEAKYHYKIGVWADLEFMAYGQGGDVEVYFQGDENDYTLLGTVSTSASSVALPAALPFEFSDSGKITARFALDHFDQWRRCRIKLVQTEADRNFRFLGYMIVARKQPIS